MKYVSSVTQSFSSFAMAVANVYSRDPGLSPELRYLTQEANSECYQSKAYDKILDDVKVISQLLAKTIRGSNELSEMEVDFIKNASGEFFFLRVNQFTVIRKKISTILELNRRSPSRNYKTRATVNNVQLRSYNGNSIPRYIIELRKSLHLPAQPKMRRKSKERQFASVPKLNTTPPNFPSINIQSSHRPSQSFSNSPLPSRTRQSSIFSADFTEKELLQLPLAKRIEIIRENIQQQMSLQQTSLHYDQIPLKEANMLALVKKEVNRGANSYDAMIRRIKG